MTFARATTRRRAPATRRHTRNCSRRSCRSSRIVLPSRQSSWRSCCSIPVSVSGPRLLLDRGEAHLRTVPRMGRLGYGISDVAIYALRGERAKALAKLARGASRPAGVGWWRYHRDFDPNLASIRNEPEFKAVFADIERDMAQQRAALAARPKDAPLELTDDFEVTDTPAERGAESTWTRLRRRKVVQWGVVYVAAAWGFLQGLEYVSEAFHWPAQLRQIALLALLIGLPIVLVLAWYHGDRGQQRITHPRVRDPDAAPAARRRGVLVLPARQRSREGCSPHGKRGSTGRIAGIKDARPSVAVLPFKNRSRLEDDAFFVDGIHDDILTQLSKIEAMKVIARTSVERFRDTKLTTKEIGEKLGVTKVLEGAVQRAGNRVRVTVQLIDATTEAHMWAESYDRELTAANIFAIQSEVAAAIAGALKATLTPAEQARATTVPTQTSAGVGGVPARQAAHGEAHNRGSCRCRTVLPPSHRPRSEVRPRVCWLGGRPIPPDRPIAVHRVRSRRATSKRQWQRLSS